MLTGEGSLDAGLRAIGRYAEPLPLIQVLLPHLRVSRGALGLELSARDALNGSTTARRCRRSST